MKRIQLGAVIALTVSFVACAPVGGMRPAGKSNLVQAAPVTAAGATLIDQLDRDAIFYMRLPNMTDGLTGTTPENAVAYGSTAHRAVIEQLRTRVKTMGLLAKLPGMAALFLEDANGPIELAVIAPGQALSPAAAVVLRVPIRATSTATLAATLTQGTPAPPVKFDANGNSVLMLQPEMPIALHFDAKSRLLSAQWKMGASTEIPAQFTAKRTGAKAVRGDFSMRAHALDPSDAGPVLIVSTKVLAPYLSIAATGEADPGQRALIQALSELETIAMGVGQVNGSGQMSLELDGFSARMLSYLPQHSTRLDVPVLGAPSSVVTVQLPNKNEIVKLAKFAVRLAGKSWRDFDDGVSALGFDPWQIFDVIGPSTQVINDDGGSILAVELKDPAAFEPYLDQVTAALAGKNVGLHRRVVRARGKDYTWLWIKAAPPAEIAEPKREARTPNVGSPFRTVGLNDADAQAAIDNSTEAYSDQSERQTTQLESLLALITNQRSGMGVYRIEGNWLLLADVPQALYGRDVNSAKLDAWMATQKQDFSHAMLGLSGRNTGWAKLGYQYYLSSLVKLANFLDTEIAIEAMPSALELNLPKSGAIGVTVDRLDRGMAFRVHYENSPLELMGGGGGSLVAVATVGVLAAIAVPAYQDYTVRAETSVGMIAASSAKVELAEATLSAGRIPKKFTFDNSSLDAKIASVEYLNQAIVVRFSDAANTQLAGKKLTISPCVAGRDQSQIVGWACGMAQCDVGVALNKNAMISTDILAKYLPAECR